MHPIELLNKLENIKGEMSTVMHPAVHARLCANMDAARADLLQQLADLPDPPTFADVEDAELVAEHNAMYETARAAGGPDGLQSPQLNQFKTWFGANEWKKFGIPEPIAKGDHLDGENLPIHFEDWAHDHLTLAEPPARPKPAMKPAAASLEPTVTQAAQLLNENRETWEDWVKSTMSLVRSGATDPTTSSGVISPEQPTDSWYQNSMGAGGASRNSGTVEGEAAPNLSSNAQARDANWEAWLNASMNTAQQIAQADPRKLAAQPEQLFALAAALSEAAPAAQKPQASHETTTATQPVELAGSVANDDETVIDDKKGKKPNDWSEWIDRTNWT